MIIGIINQPRYLFQIFRNINIIFYRLYLTILSIFVSDSKFKLLFVKIIQNNIYYYYIFSNTSLLLKQFYNSIFSPKVFF